jgi:hypothetical protein
MQYIHAIIFLSQVGCAWPVKPTAVSTLHSITKSLSFLQRHLTSFNPFIPIIPSKPFMLSRVYSGLAFLTATSDVA